MKKKILSLLLILSMGLTMLSTAHATPPQQPKPHLKKDGTPDMRHKENKKPPPPPVHTKKDGTPDKRFKENKPKPVPPPPVHAKKDGTPDKRFKENKPPKKK